MVFNIISSSRTLGAYVILPLFLPFPSCNVRLLDQASIPPHEIESIQDKHET